MQNVHFVLKNVLCVLCLRVSAGATTARVPFSVSAFSPNPLTNFSYFSIFTHNVPTPLLVRSAQSGGSFYLSVI